MKPLQNIFINIKIKFLYSVVVSPIKGRSLIEKLIEHPGRSRRMLAKLIISAEICKS